MHFGTRGNESERERERGRYLSLANLVQMNPIDSLEVLTYHVWGDFCRVEPAMAIHSCCSESQL